MTLRNSFLGFVLLLFVAILLQIWKLPDVLATYRPMWVPLALAFWAFVAPGRVSLLLAWCVGLMLDVMFNTVLGQHAIGLVITVYVVSRMRKFLVVLPFWQTTLAMVPVWLLYAVLMFWIDGARDQSADLWMRWMPVISTSLLWPIVVPLLSQFSRGRRDD